jgi:hypothetical protein
MLGTALAGQPLYSNRDVDEMVLLSMVGVAVLTIAITRGQLGSTPATKEVNS